MSNILYKDESYTIVGILFEVYNNLGSGFSEIVYKDAIEYEFEKQNIPFQREKQYSVTYKDVILKHKFYADFVVFDKIILEIKSVESIHDKHIVQCLNYLKVSNCKLAIIANFHKYFLDHKRIILQDYKSFVYSWQLKTRASKNIRVFLATKNYELQRSITTPNI